MARKPNPDAPIIALYALHTLYKKYKCISEDNFNDRDYAAKLTEFLIKDGILKDTRGKDNFIRLFRGLPIESRLEDAPGIDISKLNEITQTVISGLNPQLLEKSSLESDGAWAEFCKRLFPSLGNEEHLRYRYFKYLPMEEKQRVKLIVNQRMNEIGIDTEDPTYNFCMYAPSKNNPLDAAPYILSINLRGEWAILYNFPPIWPSTKSIARSFNGNNSSLLINFYDSHNRLESIQMIMLRANRDQVADAPLITGTFINGSIFHLSTCVVVAERCSSFPDARERIYDSDRRSDLFQLEVKGKQLETPRALQANQLSRYEEYRILNQLEGHYLIVLRYDRNDLQHEEENVFKKWICEISCNGNIRIIGAKADSISGSILFLSEETISINVNNEKERIIDLHLKVAIQRTKVSRTVRVLSGYFISEEQEHLHKGKIAFIRLDCKNNIEEECDFDFNLHQPLYDSMYEIQSNSALISAWPLTSRMELTKPEKLAYMLVNQ